MLCASSAQTITLFTAIVLQYIIHVYMYLINTCVSYHLLDADGNKFMPIKMMRDRATTFMVLNKSLVIPTRKLNGLVRQIHQGVY